MLNFAGMPENGGGMEVLKGYDLTTDVPSNKSTEDIFQHRPLFVDNCKDCKNEVSMLNADGDNKQSAFQTIFSGLQWGVNIWADDQQRKSAEEQAQAAIQIEQARLAAERTKLAQEQAKSSGFAGKLKAYTTPIIVTGVVVIAGIGAYFYFKKKKIS